MESSTSEPTKFSTATTTPGCTSQIVTPPAMGQPYTPLSISTEDDNYYFEKRAYENELGYTSTDKQFEAYIQAAINNYTSYHGLDDVALKSTMSVQDAIHKPTMSVRDAIVRLQNTSAGVRGWAVSGIKASASSSSS